MFLTLIGNPSVQQFASTCIHQYTQGKRRNYIFDRVYKLLITIVLLAAIYVLSVQGHIDTCAASTLMGAVIGTVLGSLFKTPE